MQAKRTVCLRQLGETRAGEVRFGRFLANAKVSPERLIGSICAATAQRAAGRHVLLIEDTTELNYQAHAQRVRGLGTVGNGRDAGLFLHPLLAVDAQDGACLGLAGIHMWLRTKKASPAYRALPIEDKESHRWLSTVEAGQKCLTGAARLTVVADRESDIYEMWDRLPDARTDLLLRACRDRMVDTDTDTDTEIKTKAKTKIQTKSEMLFSWLSSQPVAGSYTLAVRARSGKRSAHQALLQVRFGRIKIKRPRSCSDPNAAKSIEVSALEVLECPSTVVGNEEPIHWRLLSTHPIETLEDACRLADWYSQRWHIEQTFRALKRQGLDVESSQVETAQGLMKLACLALDTAVRSIQLTLAREGQSHRPASDVFTNGDIALLGQLQPTLEGRTAKQKNPHQAPSLAWAAWIIARLGGWKGYASERKPGPITMHRGLVSFALMATGWRAALGAKDVCMP